MSEVSPQTFNATVWRGKDDEEPIASAMDFQDRLGRVWVSFSLGQDPARSHQFQMSLMPAVRDRWPETASLPIMPNGGIPLRSEEHTSELQSLMRISYAVFCYKKKK